MISRRERVIRAIHFDSPDRLPIWMFNRDDEIGDVMWYDYRVSAEDQGDDYQAGTRSEWGYRWQRLDDGTMGQPHEPVLPDWNDLDGYTFPDVNADLRLAGLAEFKERSEDFYRLPMLIITGFTTYTFLRGFENAMMDFMAERRRAEKLLDRIFAFEKELMALAAEAGFDGFHFGDDWGMQNGLVVSPQLWREIFKPRYRDQFEHAHNLGLHVWFHSCGNPGAILGDLHEIGVDVMNIAQPNVVDLQAVSRNLRGRQCFLLPISYQTVSITGTPEEILAEGRRLLPGVPAGVA